MANVLLGAGVTDIRGSIGGTTFSRSAAGNYARARMKPVNPRSALQSARRAQVGHLTKYWSGTLTEQQRSDWRAYAAGTGWTNKLGQSIQISGLAAFLQLNATRAVGSLAITADAPLAMGHAGGVEFTFAAESDTSKIQLEEPTGAFDKTVPGHVLTLFQGLPTEAGRISIPKGFRFIGKVEGADPVPPVFPLEFSAAYTMAAGQRVTVKAMFQDESFRSSGPFLAAAAAAPAS